MKNYKITIQYDGTKYNGWQRQGNTRNTIQEKFENVLSAMCGRHTDIFASGRTDAGVHAKCQVANFKCETQMTENEILEYLNHYLPEDIKVTSIEEKDLRFHSRLNAKSKTYEYNISTVKCDVFTRKYTYTELTSISLYEMQKAAQLLVGTHDFIGFSSIKKNKKSTIRTINYIDITEEHNLITIKINGDGFLYNMVRIIAGTLLDIGKGKLEPTIITNVLNTGSREEAGRTLPACGLKLTEVYY